MAKTSMYKKFTIPDNENCVGRTMPAFYIDSMVKVFGIFFWFNRVHAKRSGAYIFSQYYSVFNYTYIEFIQFYLKEKLFQG